MKVIITTYKNPDFPSYLSTCTQRLTELGYDYNIEVSNHNDKKTYTICYFNILDILNKYYNEDLLICEDDILVNTPYEKLKEIIDLYEPKEIVRVGYKKIVKWKRRTRNGKLVIGGDMVYIPKEYQKKLLLVMKRNRPQHLDCFLSANKELSEIVLPKSHCDAIEHYSRILRATRKGIKTSS